MNKLTKGLILFLALILPVLIFVFLKIFGENEFDVPVFNHTIISPEVECENITIPHVVGEIKIEDEILTASHVVNIYHIIGTAIASEEMRGLMKVKDRLEGEDVVMRSIGAIKNSLFVESISKKYQIEGIWQMYAIKQQSNDEFINCELMISGNESIVLVDNQGRIRGYYNGSDEEETDRLILESKILIYGTEKNE